MKTFTHRIAFVMSGNQVVATGGIGQFTKAFATMAQLNGWAIDLILDKAPPDNDFVKLLSNGLFQQIIWPDKPYTYERHRNTHAFFESYNIEKAANFRDSMMKALQANLYDMVLINVSEAQLPILALGLQTHIPVVFYTHNANMVFYKSNRTNSVFSVPYEELTQRLMANDLSFTGTQTQRNAEELVKSGVMNGVVLPMPMTEPALLEPNPFSVEERSGVLFVGRWETLKNHHEFLRMIEATKLPAKIMTNSNGAASFKEALDGIGATYEIKHTIHGQEKVDFIKSAKLCYLPSKAESYGFALWECLGHIPCVVLEEYPWYTNFDLDKLHIAKKKEVDSLIKDLYSNAHNGHLDYAKQLNFDVADFWVKFLEEHARVPVSISSASNISKKDNLFYDQHTADLKRKIGIEDVYSVYNARGKLKTIFTETRTWLTSEESQPMTIESSSDTLDEFFV